MFSDSQTGFFHALIEGMKMGLFNAATSLLSHVVDRAVQVAGAVTEAVTDVAKAVVGTSVQLAEQQAQTAVASVHDALTSVGNTVQSAVHSVEQIAGDALNTAGSAVSTIGTTLANGQDILGDLLNGRIEPQDYLKLIGDLGQGVLTTAGNAQQLTSDSVQFAGSVYNFANQGGSISLGDSNGLLSINLIGSLLGGNTDQGVIPDTRGSIGALPINVTFTSDGLTFGGETPITPLLTAALALTPYTAPLVPLLTPLNLGGLGVVGSVSAEGFSAKFYGIAGPSYNVGVASASTTLELGSYNKVQLLSWNSLSVSDLPVVGNVLGQLPVIKDLSISLPSLDLHFDSKLYAQAIGNLDVAGVGPQAQLEVVHDLDNDLSLLATVASSAIDSGLHGAGNVLNVAFHGADTAPPVQTIGSDPVFDQALAA
jgi:hypothetical protein